MQEPSHLRRWGAIYLLLALFLASWAAEFFTQMVEFTNEQHAHGASFSWSEYLPSFLASTFENWQSEWLQLVFQGVVLLGFKHQLFKADAEDDEKMNAKLDRILASVERQK